MIRRALAILILLAPGVLLAQNPGMFGNVFGIQFPVGFGAAYKGVAYSKTFLATNAPSGSTLTWSVSSGSLPAGLAVSTVSNNGLISGTPTGSGASSFTLQWTTGGSPPTTATSPILSITVNTLSAVTVTPTGQTLNPSATLQMSASCAWTPSPLMNPPPPCPVTWSGSGAPAGSFTSIGSTTGLLTAGASGGTITVHATSSGATGSVVGTATVAVAGGATITISPSTLPNGQASSQGGFLYPEPGTPAGANQLTATGGTPPYTWALNTGSAALPAGLSLSSGGLISGTTSAGAASSTPTFKVTDSLTNSTTKAIAITIATPSGNPATTCTPSTITLGGQSQCRSIVTFTDSSTQDVSSGNSLTPGVPQAATPATTTTLTVNVPVSSGQGYVACARQGLDNTSVMNFTDSASQTPVTIATLTTYGTTRSSKCVWVASSAAVTSETVSYTGAGSTMNFVVMPITGNSSSLDGSPKLNGVTGGAASSSQACGPYTTTNANDIIFCWQDQAQDESSFNVSSPFSLPSGGASSRSALAFETVSAIQTALAPTISWSPATPTSYGNIMFAIKAAGGAGATWNPPGGVGGTISSSGLFTGTVAGSATVTSTYAGATSPAATITVQGQTDTSLVVSPSNGFGTVGGSNANFTAAGNSTHTDYTGKATWSSNDTTVATSLGLGVYGCLKAATTTVTAAATGLVSGTASLQCSNPVTGTLLGGASVTGCGTISVPTPAGWSIVSAEGFEGGNICNQPAGESLAFGSITNTRAHSGQFSAFQLINCDQCTVQWNLNGALGTFNDVYASWWEFDESQALYNDEMFLVDMQNQAGGTFNQEITFDLYGFAFNTPTPSAMNVGNNASGGGNGSFACTTGSSIICNGVSPAGAWHQWEAWFHPSTGNTTNGFMQMWMDGKLVSQTLNANLNGTTTMSGNITTFFVGGNYTKLLWTNNGQVPPSGTCTDFGTGQGFDTSASFTTIHNLCPNEPLVPNFNRFIDDIIVIKK